MADRRQVESSATSAPRSRSGADQSQLARWLEVVEFAIENGPERVDALLELAESLESALLASRCVEAAS